HLHFLQRRFVGWFLDKPGDPTIDAALHDAELGDVAPWNRLCGQRNVRAKPNVLQQQRAKIHSVQLVAAEDQVVVVWSLEEVPHVLSNRVGGSLVPLRAGECLLRSENVDKTAREVVEFIAGLYVPVQ